MRASYLCRIREWSRQTVHGHGPTDVSLRRSPLLERRQMQPPQAPAPPPRRPDAGAPTPSSLRRKNLLAIAIVIAVFVLVGPPRVLAILGGDSSRSGSHEVRYAVGGGNGASVTYQTSSQDSAQDTNAGTPWSDSETMNDGDCYYASAQNQGGGT